MATNAIGTNIELAGWALVQQVTQPSGEYSAEYRGNMDTLSAAVAKVKATADYDTINVSVDASTGVATITISRGANNTATKVPTGETKMPTCNIAGSMLSPKLHQAPFFLVGEGDSATPLPLEMIKGIEWSLKNIGIVTTGDFFPGFNAAQLAKGHAYAAWRVFGIDTYLSPSYQMTITHYLEPAQKSNLAAYYKEAGKVWSWATAINKLPTALRPQDMGVPAWLAQAPSVSYTKDGITVTQVFIGAEKFPAFYPVETGTEGLTYEPPALPEGYWRDSKWVQSQMTSGEAS